MWDKALQFIAAMKHSRGTVLEKKRGREYMWFLWSGTNRTLSTMGFTDLLGISQSNQIDISGLMFTPIATIIQKFDAKKLKLKIFMTYLSRVFKAELWPHVGPNFSTFSILLHIFLQNIPGIKFILKQNWFLNPSII